MSNSLSLNTQAILLLTAPLLVGRNQASAEILTPGEYKHLARRLYELQHQPSDLLALDADALIKECSTDIAADRLKQLVGRGFLLSQAIDRWQARSIWVMSRADATYPTRLKVKLKDNAPAILYGCGAWGELDSGGLAVVGSRDADDAHMQYTLAIGRLAAQAHHTIISGGARGIDQAAMRGALEASGKVIGILADGLEQASLNRDYRSALMEHRLALISPYDPSAGFNVGNAMQRNKLIYALSDAALVVNSDYQKGGTWAGAVEQLDKLKYVPVYVRWDYSPSKGLEELRKKGARPWPEIADAAALVVLLKGNSDPTTEPIEQRELQFEAHENLLPLFEVTPPDAEYKVTPTPQADEIMPSVGEELFAKVRELLLKLLHTPMQEAQIAVALGVSVGQARQWLTRLVDEGVVVKKGDPAHYATHEANLFDVRRDPPAG